MSRATIILFIALAIFSSNIFVSCQLSVINCDRENEEYQCGSACQTKCDNLGQPCPTVNVRCNDACYCKAGYARITKDDSKCIPIANCP